MVPLLADKADITLPSAIRAHKSLRIHTDARYVHLTPDSCLQILTHFFSDLPRHSDAILHLLSHLYALRSSSLWKVKSRSAWFAATVSSLEGKLPTMTLGASLVKEKPTSPSLSLFHSLYSRPALAYSVYRHVIVLEHTTRAGRLFGFLPPNVITAKQLACDPVPPPTHVSEYDPDFFQGAEDPLAVRPRGRRENQRMLEQLIPDAVFRRQLQVRSVVLFLNNVCCLGRVLSADAFICRISSKPTHNLRNASPVVLLSSRSSQRRCLKRSLRIS